MKDNQDKIYIFGYGATGRQIAKNLHQINDVTVVDTDENILQIAKDDGFRQLYSIDITSDAQIAKLNIDQNKNSVICAMDDEAVNIFLVISLRSIYENIQIIAISNSLEMNQKLSIAGATKVIDIYEPSSNRIYNILQKPHILKTFDILFNPKSNISFKEFIIPAHSPFIGKRQSDLDLQKENLILIGVMDSESKEHFTFTTHGYIHIIDSGDILVCMGKDCDLEKFKQKFTEAYS